MPPAVFLLALLTTVGIAAFTVIKVASLFAAKRALPSDVTERFEELENDVQVLRQELASAQERLDFAERLLSSARDDRR